MNKKINYLYEFWDVFWDSTKVRNSFRILHNYTASLLSVCVHDTLACFFGWSSSRSAGSESSSP